MLGAGMARKTEPAARLDPDARNALDLAAATGKPPLQELSPAEARAIACANRRMFDAPPPAVLTNDRALPGPAGPIPVRRYRPRGVEVGEALPGLIYFHGGGWVTGDLDHGAWLCASLADRLGIAVLSVGYRLAPEHPFPAAVDDSLAALEWIAAHGAAMGVDPTRLSVMGDSAGGGLAAVAALHARDAGLPLRAQILLYPIVDNAEERPSFVCNAAGYGLTAEGMRWYRGHYLAAANPTNWHASPLRCPKLHGSAPALIVTCGFDVLRDEGLAYAEALAGVGVPVQHTHYAGQIHGFITRAGVIREASTALSEVATVVGNAILNSPPVFRSGA